MVAHRVLLAAVSHDDRHGTGPAVDLRPGYQQAQGVLVILGASMLFATAVGTVDIVLLMAGKSSWNLLNAAVAVIINVALNLVFDPPIRDRGCRRGMGRQHLP